MMDAATIAFLTFYNENLLVISMIDEATNTFKRKTRNITRAFVSQIVLLHTHTLSIKC